MPHCSTTHRRSSILILCLALATAVSAAAQQESPPPKPDTDPLVSDLLEPTPLLARSLGVELNIPRGARILPQKTANGVSLVVSEDSDNPRWSMRIQQMASSLAEPTASAEVDDHLESLEAHEAK